jgi:hypothetical protein
MGVWGVWGVWGVGGVWGCVGVWGVCGGVGCVWGCGVCVGGVGVWGPVTPYVRHSTDCTCCDFGHLRFYTRELVLCVLVLVVQ